MWHCEFCLQLFCPSWESEQQRGFPAPRMLTGSSWQGFPWEIHREFVPPLQAVGRNKGSVMHYSARSSMLCKVGVRSVIFENDLAVTVLIKK